MEDIIDAKSLTLEEFLKSLSNNDYHRLYPNNHIPTEEMMVEFLDTISERSDKEIKNILRKFLIRNSTFGIDRLRAEFLIENLKNGKQSEPFDEYDRRILNKVINKKSEVWEGLTWVLDLLPHFPLDAIKAVDAYFLANCQTLPDTCLNALSDCSTIISARYINYQHSKEIFWALPPKDFEYLVAALYETIGYEVKLTKASYDGGIDVHAQRTEVTKREKIVIQCKRYTTKRIGVEDVRSLLGVVSDNKSTKGVLVTTSLFSSEARKFEKNNPSIELIDYVELTKLLNGHFGTYWNSKISSIINEQKSKSLKLL